MILYYQKMIQYMESSSRFGSCGRRLLSGSPAYLCNLVQCRGHILMNTIHIYIQSSYSTNSVQVIIEKRAEDICHIIGAGHSRLQRSAQGRTLLGTEARAGIPRKYRFRAAERRSKPPRAKAEVGRKASRASMRKSQLRLRGWV